MIEGKRTIIFIGVILNILLLNQPVTSNFIFKADPGINDYRLVSRVHERPSYPNSSLTNQHFEIGRHRSDLTRFRSESYRRIINTPSESRARFSFIGRSEERSQFERQRRIFSEPFNDRQKRNRAIINDHIQRRSIEMDNNRYMRDPVAASERRFSRDSFSSLKSRFLNFESSRAITAVNNRDGRVNSRIRDTRNSEFLLHRIHELRENVNRFRNHRTRDMRMAEAPRDHSSNRVLSRNSETSIFAPSFLKSTLSQYIPHNSVPSLEWYQINDFVVSTIAGMLLYDIMGAMTQNKAGAMKKELFGNFFEKMVFNVRKMVAH